MGHVTKGLPWCLIDIDTTEGRVFFQERWRYTWMVSIPLRDWTHREKIDFHGRADRHIWAAWSNRVVFNVAGGSRFARRFSRRGVRINLDIRWVTSREHWNVTVWKIPAAEHRTSKVFWNTRTILLDTNDFDTRTFNHAGPPATTSRLVPVAHEFGHAAGNTVVLGRGDERRTGHANVNDHSSIMNAGSQLRARHFRTIIAELNTMIPDCTFSVRNV